MSFEVAQSRAKYAEGVIHQSPGSAAKPRHPGSKINRYSNPKGVSHCAASLCNPVGVEGIWVTITQGGAATPLTLGYVV